MAFVEIKKLSQAYDRLRVLKGIQASFKEGEVAIILGPNGSGKTTLLKVIAGLLKPLEGEIRISGRSPAFNLFLPEGGLYDDLTLLENLRFFQNLYGASENDFHQLSEVLLLREILQVRVRHLSHGQRVRGGLCRTFLAPVGVYLLDEPLAGLDEVSVRFLIGLLKSLSSEGRTLLVTTHDAGALKGVGDRWLLIESGVLKEILAPM